MKAEIREKFNAEFSDEKYKSFVENLKSQFPDELDFRVAESPLFVPKAVKNKVLQACDAILKEIQSEDFIAKTEKAIPAEFLVPNENKHSSFLAIDFAITKNEKGTIEPQLIELQGFPSLFGLQYFLAKEFKANYEIPENYSPFFNGFEETTFVEKMKDFLLNGHSPDEVIILEIYPEKQKTRIDFAISKVTFGIDAVCLTNIKVIDSQLFREKNGELIQIKRIYNRLIFDDLANYSDLKFEFDFTKKVDVEWCGHPNWFYRISKFAMPFLKSKYIPKSYFLNQFDIEKADLSQFVLKPLFSFAGSGVKLTITKEDLEAIADKENYLIQQKVNYEPIIQAIEGAVKCEIRMLYIWPDAADEPILITNLARLSRGEMIGVRFNQNFDWVGGSIGFFEK